MWRAIFAVLSVLALLGCAGANGKNATNKRQQRRESGQLERVITKLFIPGADAHVQASAPSSTVPEHKTQSQENGVELAARVVPQAPRSSYESLIDDSPAPAPFSREISKPKVQQVVNLGQERIVLFNSDLLALDSEEIMRLRGMK